MPLYFIYILASIMSKLCAKYVSFYSHADTKPLDELGN